MTITLQSVITFLQAIAPSIAAIVAAWYAFKSNAQSTATNALVTASLPKTQ